MQDARTPSSTGFRRRCAAWRVTFLCVAKEKSPKERPPPLVRPPASGSLSSPVCPTARADGPSMAQRRSLGVLPRGLDKRTHLGEQQGATANPPHRGWLTASGVFEAVIGRDVISDPAPRPPHGEIRLSRLCNKHHQHGCIGEKIMVSKTASGRYAYREMVVYQNPDNFP